MSERFIVERALTGAGVLSRCGIEVVDGHIAAIEPDADPGRFGPIRPGWALPGYVDTHVHGGAGFDFGTADADGIAAIIAQHRAHGTTAMYASLVSATIERTVDQVALLAGFVERGELRGIHLEGPFLSEARRGAHPVSLLRDADPESVDRLLAAGRGTIAMVTLAPERAGAGEAMQRFINAGVCVAVGHCEASAEITRAAIDAGARVATHLFNTMPPIHHRVPGPVPVLLTDPRVGIELICDGVHLDPEVVTMALRVAGPQRTMLITDAMAATGQPDGEFALGELMTKVIDGTARLLAADGRLGNIAGSTLTMDRAVEFVTQRCGATLVEAATMASTTPARWHSIPGAGVLAVGEPADLVLVGDQGALHAVMAAGRWA